MFLRSDAKAGARGKFKNRFFVERFYGVYVYDRNINAFRGKDSRSLDCGVNENTGCKNNSVVARFDRNSLIRIENIAVSVEYDRHCKSAQTEINGTVVQKRGFCRVVRFGRVCGVENHHFGYGAHDRDVFAVLMRCAVLTDSDSRVACADFYVEMGISHRISYLFICSSAGEHCKR